MKNRQSVVKNRQSVVRNPLNKRFPRELKSEIAKYLVLFLFLGGIISLISGFMVAGESMVHAYNESFEKYNIEDGNFEFQNEISDEIIAEIEEDAANEDAANEDAANEDAANEDAANEGAANEDAANEGAANEDAANEGAASEDTANEDAANEDAANSEEVGITIYSNFYKEEETKEVDSTLRVFKNRTDIDLVCLMEGDLANAADEIAIDRMYADNNSLKVGDSLTLGKKKFKITGLVALSDYSALFSNTSDMMFDAVKFGVAVMTEEGFDSLSDNNLHYSYSWLYDKDDKPADDEEAKEMAEDLGETLSNYGTLVNMIPEFTNQAIIFTGNDLGDDQTMMQVFLYIVIIIIAFVVAIMTSNTITKESAVIGTLRASGYTKKELIRHYLTMPVLVMLVAAVIGNVLGYTYFKDLFADMYYASYSLPTFVTRWNAEAFLRTTLVPLVILILINYLMLRRKLSLTPLQFMRRDLSRKKKKKILHLSHRIHFMSRFRMRVVFQNMANYLTLFVGVFFAIFVLLFGTMLLPMLNHYQDQIVDNMISDYQYVLQDIDVESLAAAGTTGGTYAAGTTGGAYAAGTGLMSGAYAAGTTGGTDAAGSGLTSGADAAGTTGGAYAAGSGLTNEADVAGGADVENAYAAGTGLASGTDAAGTTGGAYAAGTGLTSGADAAGTTGGAYAAGTGLTNEADVAGAIDELLSTDTKGLEKYSITSLKTHDGERKQEDVSVYGVNPESKYVDIDFKDEDDVYLSLAFAEKYDIEVGDTITLDEPYESGEYTFKVSGIYNYPSAIAIFMENDYFEQVFDKREGYFNGYFSNEEITDIDEKYISTVITLDDLDKTCRQLKLSLGSNMKLLEGFGIIMFALIIYLLAKIIIEKNSESISMAKILGYTDREINHLYITPTTIVVILSILVTTPLSNLIMGYLCDVMFGEYSGWLPYYMPSVKLVQIGLICFVTYAVVAFFQMRRVKKIPMTDALKNVE